MSNLGGSPRNSSAFGSRTSSSLRKDLLKDFEGSYQVPDEVGHRSVLLGLDVYLRVPESGGSPGLVSFVRTSRTRVLRQWWGLYVRGGPEDLGVRTVSPVGGRVGTPEPPSSPDTYRRPGRPVSLTSQRRSRTRDGCLSSPVLSTVAVRPETDRGGTVWARLRCVEPRPFTREVREPYRRSLPGLYPDPLPSLRGCGPKPPPSVTKALSWIHRVSRRVPLSRSCRGQVRTEKERSADLHRGSDTNPRPRTVGGGPVL